MERLRNATIIVISNAVVVRVVVHVVPLVVALAVPDAGRGGLMQLPLETGAKATGKPGNPWQLKLIDLLQLILANEQKKCTEFITNVEAMANNA